MTKLTFIDSHKSTTFGDLKIGDLFTCNEGGLFMKTENVHYDAIVVVAVSPCDVHIQAGRLSVWNSNDEIIPISALTATKESDMRWQEKYDEYNPLG